MPIGYQILNKRALMLSEQFMCDIVIMGFIFIVYKQGDILSKDRGVSLFVQDEFGYYTN